MADTVKNRLLIPAAFHSMSSALAGYLNVWAVQFKQAAPNVVQLPGQVSQAATHFNLAAGFPGAYQDLVAGMDVIPDCRLPVERHAVDAIAYRRKPRASRIRVSESRHVGDRAGAGNPAVRRY